jgi:hypothetical protein
VTPTLLEREGSEFTRYEGYAVEFREASHRYWLVRGQERIPAVSVTAALKVIAKPQLVPWAERMGCEGALRLERAGSLVYPDGGRVPVTEAITIVRQTGQGADAKRETGGDRGTALHVAQRTYFELGTIPKLSDFDPEHRGYVQGYCKWLLRDRPEPVLVERPVGSIKHAYAGQLDSLAKIKGRHIVLDLKTSARTYVEQHLQLAGYMNAVEECMPDQPLDAGMVVLLSRGGRFTTHPCRADAKHFLRVLACYRAVRQVHNALTAS